MGYPPRTRKKKTNREKGCTHAGSTPSCVSGRGTSYYSWPMAFWGVGKPNVRRLWGTKDQQFGALGGGRKSKSSASNQKFGAVGGKKI